VIVFGRCDLWRKNCHGRKKQNEGKPDDSRRISENPVQGKFEFTQSGVRVGHVSFV
jgi:hypothetical protein